MPAKPGREADPSEPGDPESAQVAGLLGRMIGDVGAEAIGRHLVGGGKIRAAAGLYEVVTRSSFTAQMIKRRLGDAIARAALGLEVRYVVDEAAFGSVPSVAGLLDELERPSRRGSRTAVASAAGSSTRAGEGRGALPSGMTPVPMPVREGPTGEPPPPRLLSPLPRAAGPCELDGFVVGRPNRLAFNAALALADGSAAAPGVLVLHGACGVGKTHLLRGAASRAASRAAGSGRPAAVRFITAEQFTSDYIEAVKSQTVPSFQRRYRGVEVLCIDDVHFLATKRGTQTEFLHTFEAIRAAGKRIVLASDEHPCLLRSFSKALISRLVSGLVFEVGLPDEDLRRKLAVEFARRAGLALSGAAADLIARIGGTEAETASVREVEGLITQVLAVSQLHPELCDQHGAVGPAAVERAIEARRHGRSALSGSGAARGGAGRGPGSAPMRVETIAQAACDALGIDRAELAGRQRHKRVVLARRVTAYLAREMTPRSFPEIAHAMGKSAHSSIIDADREFRQQVKAEGCVAVGSVYDGLSFRAFAGEVARRIG